MESSWPFEMEFHKCLGLDRLKNLGVTYIYYIFFGPLTQKLKGSLIQSSKMLFLE